MSEKEVQMIDDTPITTMIRSIMEFSTYLSNKG